MSKKKTETEMRAIAEMIKNMVKDWNEDEEPDDLDDEENEDEEENEEEEDQYYRYPECECVDGECDQCDHWVNTDYCELDDIYENCEGHEICGCSDEDCYSCEDSKEHTQTEDLSKFITSVNTALGGDMGLLVFDKSNKKDMEKIAAIFEEYAKRLS